MPSAKQPARSQRRQATEDRLLDALETVLVRDGIRHVGLNAVVEESGVAKPLLYRYFENLRGLLSAWVERRGPWSRHDSPPMKICAEDEVDTDETDAEFLGRLAEQLVETADTLREQPVMLEMLAEELTADSELSKPFAQVRRRRSKTFMRMMLRDARYTDPVTRARIILMNAAVTYLAMRAHRSPRFMGLRLDTRKGWDEAMDMVRLTMTI